jgi:hypothetical protein
MWYEVLPGWFIKVFNRAAVDTFRIQEWGTATPTPIPSPSNIWKPE